MEIVEYQPRYLQDLTALYNELTASVPHCYPIRAQELAAAFGGACGYESRGRRLTSEAVFVAIDRDVVGFIHVGEGTESVEGSEVPRGIIRFLGYPRGRRQDAQGLLRHGEEWLRGRGLTSVLVYRQAYRYPFYHFSHAFLSNHLEHIQALLLVNGYEVCGGEVFLDWPDMDPVPLHAPGGLDFELETKHVPVPGGLPDIRLSAHHRGAMIGECVSINARAFSNRDVVNDWIFTQWLGISDEFQGRGLGRFLLANSLIEARRIGYRHAGISTALDNHRALLFYANFGYTAVDWTRQFSRDLTRS